jgi:hypothetical protein
VAVTAEREYLEFEPDAPANVLARMEDLASDRSGRSGWINFHPKAHETADPPQESSLFGIFSATGPAVPICTWMPGKWRGDRRDPVSIGVQHGAGPRAVSRLGEAGVEVPTTWRVRQDHPRRGLVVLVPSDQDHDTTLRWLLRAGNALSAVPLVGIWQAAIFRKG